MMKNIKAFVCGTLLLSMGLIPYGCSDDDKNTSLAGNDILSFSIEGIDTEAVIDTDNKSISYVLSDIPENYREITPVFTLSEGAWARVNEDEVVSGVTPVNFSTPVTFKITTSNGDRAYWDVSLSNTDYTIAWGLGAWLTEEKSNEGVDPDGCYLDQQNTGDYADRNCGPAVGAMAVIWYGSPMEEMTVEWARSYRYFSYYSSSSTDLSWYPGDVRDFINFCSRGGSPAYLEEIPSEKYLDNNEEEMKEKFPVQVKAHIDAGELVIVCLSMSYISKNETGDSETRVDKYYSGTMGHFLLIKGYKVVDGELFFECNDPWGLGLTYEDGTPVGANRYYRAEELALSGNHNYYAVIVQPKV